MAKSMIAELQAELAQKRELVEQCESALDTERAAAEEYVAKKLAKATAALEAAKRDADEFVARIAQALGLPHPTAAKQARARLKRVRELLEGGMTQEQIATETDTPLEQVKADIARIRAKDAGGRSEDGKHGAERQPPEEGHRGWKREQVRRLFLDGLTRGEIAEKLGIAPAAVNAHVTGLRGQGRLPAAGTELPESSSGEEDDADDEGTTPKPARKSTSAPPVLVGDALEALRVEVARQQNGQRAKAAKLVTVRDRDHNHRVLVDRMGDGCTQADDSGHVHKVFRFVTSVAAGHQHALKVPSASELWT